MGIIIIIVIVVIVMIILIGYYDNIRRVVLVRFSVGAISTFEGAQLE